jgi:hypothetical protein
MLFYLSGMELNLEKISGLLRIHGAALGVKADISESQEELELVV